VTKIVKPIRATPLQYRLFGPFLEDVEAEYSNLISSMELWK